MVEHTLLVRVQLLGHSRPEPDVEDTRAALLDVDDVPRRQVDQRRGHRVVGDTEVVGEEVRDRGRLGTELERPRTDRWLGRTS